MIFKVMLFVIICVTILITLTLTKRLNKVIYSFFLLGYLFLLVYLLFFPRYFGNADTLDIIQGSFQLSPLESFYNSILMAQLSDSYYLLVWNWVGNFVLLMPIAISIGYYKKSIKLFPTMFYGFFISIVIEIAQLLTNIYIYRYSNKVVDIDDIIFNGIGFLLCYIVVYIVKKRMKK